ncbi:hypothetical protein MNBD_DELTA03-320 [hydrothermal vent metagenome]|uniref:Uncharacterized protein n=1 Tax=hydrothermal vent metagenome TaxID=652676 RepID=A0A3B0VA60_9ZZZZ
MLRFGVCLLLIKDFVLHLPCQAIKYFLKVIKTIGYLVSPNACLWDCVWGIMPRRGGMPRSRVPRLNWRKRLTNISLVSN